VSARTARSLVRGLGAALVLGTAMGGCAGLVGGADSASPSTPTASRPPSSPTPRPVDVAQAQRLQRVMTPLIKAMDHPLPLNQVKVGIMDDPRVNAASAANDQHLAGVLAHELAHDDLRHVAKAQALGTGITIGMVLLDQVIPGSGAVAAIPGKLLMNRYTQSEEYAADRHGTDLLQKAGLSPTIMADTLTWLMQTEGGSSGGFFSTHPATNDRIEALRRPR